LGGAVIAASIGYLAYLGAASSARYYLLVDECPAAARELRDCRVRVSGRVGLRSLRISADRREAAFLLVGSRHKLPVCCTGLLPDNLAEDMDVVVEGTLRGDGRLEGDSVITRCASKYTPSET
jgi:cytochrome c-type biogenesis protein CcmE